MDRRKTALLVALAGIFAVMAAALLNWKSLRMEWYRRQAVRDATRDEAKIDLTNLSSGYDEFPMSWKALVDGGEEGFQALSKLLVHPDERVWGRAVWTIDFSFAMGRGSVPSIQDHETVVRALRKRSQLTLLRYLIIPPYQHGTDWRGSLEDALLAEGERWIPPRPECVEFCEDILQGRIDGQRLDQVRELKERAVDALFLMLEPVTGSGSSSSRGPASQREGVLHVLKSFIESGRDPDLALWALDRFLDHREGLSLEDWECFFRLRLPTYHPRTAKYSKGSMEGFLDPADLAALVRLDHPRVLRILIRLDRDPKGKEAIDAALSRETPNIPIPLPRWRPFRDAALRFLKGSSYVRPGGALALVDLGGEESVQAIAEAFEHESDSEMGLLYRSCLIALGKDRPRSPVSLRFKGCLMLLKGFIEEHGSIEHWDFSRHELFKKDGVEFQEIASNLLRSGDRQALESVVECLMNGGPDFLELPMASAVDGFPLWEVFDDRDRLAAWWAENREKLRWDPAKRLFGVK